MKALLALSLVFFASFSTHAQSLTNFCDKFNEPADIENPSQQQIHDYQHYSIVESLEKLYSGKRMKFKTPNDLAQHQEKVATVIRETTEHFGYSVSTEQLLYCSNKNTAGIDFNLLRFAAYSALRNIFIF